MSEDCEKKFAELDKIILSLQMEHKVFDTEIASLRASRHEYGNWLNRHNLEVQGLQLENAKMSNNLQVLFDKVDKIDLDINKQEVGMITQFATLKAEFNTQLVTIKAEFTKEANQLRSDLRQNSWAVALIVGILVAFGKAALSKLGF